jgi:hypothetical protein
MTVHQRYSSFLSQRPQRWMADRCVLIFSQVPAHPGNTFSAHDVVGVDHRF